VSISSFSNFEGPDFVAFAVAAASGFFAGTFFPAGPTAIYVGVLVSYHLFLAWLVFIRTANTDAGVKKAGISLPIVHTVITHAACLVLILAPVAIALHSMPSLLARSTDSDDPTAAITTTETERHAMRLIQGVCGSIAALAVFERRWLFSSESNEAPRPQPAPQPSLTVRSTADDAAEWQRYVAANQRSFPPGTSLKAEYQKWLAARSLTAAGQNQPSPPPRG
jgi:hypothetical protein